MAWTPAYNLVSIERLSQNLLDIFARDQLDALAWASPDPILAPFTYFGQARRVDQQIFPSCLALPVRMPMTQSNEEAAVEMRQEVIIEIANVAPDPDKLAREMLTRARVIVAMVLSASPVDIFAGVSTSGFGGLVWDVQELQINEWPRQNAQGLYMSAARALAVFSYIET
jgi:hypothetical protein